MCIRDRFEIDQVSTCEVVVLCCTIFYEKLAELAEYYMANFTSAAAVFGPEKKHCGSSRRTPRHVLWKQSRLHEQRPPGRGQRLPATIGSAAAASCVTNQPLNCTDGRFSTQNEQLPAYKQ